MSPDSPPRKLPVSSAPRLRRSIARCAAAQDRLPGRGQQATLRSLGDEQVRTLAQRYADAIEQGDTDMLLSMLTADATWSMPPFPTWYRGHESIADFLRVNVFSVEWRHLPARANGQIAAVTGFLIGDEIKRSGYDLK